LIPAFPSVWKESDYAVWDSKTIRFVDINDPDAYKEMLPVAQFGPKNDEKKQKMT
jgi:hypothetical protein